VLLDVPGHVDSLSRKILKFSVGCQEISGSKKMWGFGCWFIVIHWWGLPLRRLGYPGGGSFDKAGKGPDEFFS
jgi:hypothetical protein